MKFGRRPAPLRFPRIAPLRARRARARFAASCEPLEDRRLLSVETTLSPTVGGAPPSDQPGIMRPTSADLAPLVGSSTPYGLTPAQIREAYGFNDIALVHGQLQGDGRGQTIAVIVAHHSPNLQSDLHAFSVQYGLPDPPSFKQVAQDGSTNYPTIDAGWTLEACLDVQWAHALAPRANILVVEASSATTTDLISAAVGWARQQPGVSVITMSFGGNEFFGQTTYDATMTTPAGHAGITFVAASGDTGNPGTYPAFSPNVLAVGGTTITLDGSNHITSETGWSGSGGGISQFETQPSYQNGIATPFSSTKRTTPDVAFDANPNSGVSVYDSDYGATPWVQVGGTSFSAPAWAGLIAVANQGRYLAGLAPLDGRSGTLPELYASPTAFRDIISGSNGTNSNAGPGYDLVTGLGSPYANQVASELIGSSSISGKVFNDLDGNGTQNGEPGLAGWTVYEDFDNDGLLDPASGVQSFSSTDTPKTIPTIGTISSTRSITGLTANILDINVTVNISHQNVGDLVLTLTSPSGVSVTLANRAGGSGNNYTSTVFDDSAFTPIAQGVAPFTGSFQPASSLARLIGTSGNGNWTLQVQDAAPGIGGTLTSWSLQIVTGDAQTTTLSDGSYQFTNLPSGTYRIREVSQSPYVQTAPAAGFYTIGLAPATNLTAKDFGNHLPPSAAPSGVDLVAVSDTGASDTDDITMLNNAGPSTKLQYDVFGTIAGATVELYADGLLIGTATASGSTTRVTTNGTTVLGPGPHSMTARQTEPGKPTSSSSPATSTQVDTSPPVPSIDAVSSPRSTSVSQMTITFSEWVNGLDVTDLVLSRNGGANLLSGAQSLSTSNGITWTLDNLNSITETAGQYELTLAGSGSGIADVAGNLSSAGAATTFLVTDGTATIAARNLFYKGSSKWNVTNNNLPGFSDDNAIAADKTAYLPGASTSGFSNVSSYVQGINGIMVDLAGVHGTITANDFIFKVGNNNSPNSWGNPLTPATVTVRAGAGTGGSDRVEITWPNGAIQNTWLQVIVRGNDALGGSNANTGLAASDVFYWGSAPGDSSAGDAGGFSVNSADEISARNDPHGLGNPAPITNVNDFNRDGFVDSADQIIARTRATTISNQLKFLAVGAAGPFAPQSSEPVPSAAAVMLSPAATTQAGPVRPAMQGLSSLAVLTDNLGVGVGPAPTAESDSTTSHVSPAPVPIRLPAASTLVLTGSTTVPDDIRSSIDDVRAGIAWSAHGAIAPTRRSDSIAPSIRRAEPSRAALTLGVASEDRLDTLAFEYGGRDSWLDTVDDELLDMLATLRQTWSRTGRADRRP